MKRSFYRFTAALTLIFCTLCLVGCISQGGKYTVVNCVSQCKEGNIYARYESFSGERHYVVKFDENSAVELEFKTERGTIAYIFYDSEDKIIKSGGIANGSATVEIEKGGKYTVKFLANDHKGEYSMKW